MDVYRERIDNAKDFEELCRIVEDAADDERITNETYCDVYSACVNKARGM